MDLLCLTINRAGEKTMDSHIKLGDYQSTRLERVLALRESLDQGTYYVSAEHLADALLARRDQGKLLRRLNIRRPSLH